MKTSAATIPTKSAADPLDRVDEAVHEIARHRTARVDGEQRLGDAGCLTLVEQGWEAANAGDAASGEASGAKTVQGEPPIQPP